MDGRRTLIQGQEPIIPVINKITLLLLIVGGHNSLVGLSAVWQLVPLFGSSEVVRSSAVGG